MIGVTRTELVGKATGGKREEEDQMEGELGALGLAGWPWLGQGILDFGFLRCLTFTDAHWRLQLICHLQSLSLLGPLPPSRDTKPGVVKN